MTGVSAPVFSMPAARTYSAATVIGAELENPENAWSASTTPRIRTATAPPKTTTAGDVLPRTSSTRTAATTTRVNQASSDTTHSFDSKTGGSLNVQRGAPQAWPYRSAVNARSRATVARMWEAA